MDDKLLFSKGFIKEIVNDVKGLKEA